MKRRVFLAFFAAALIAMATVNFNSKPKPTTLADGGAPVPMCGPEEPNCP